MTQRTAFSRDACLAADPDSLCRLAPPGPGPAGAAPEPSSRSAKTSLVLTFSARGLGIVASAVRAPEDKPGRNNPSALSSLRTSVHVPDDEDSRNSIGSS